MLFSFFFQWPQAEGPAGGGPGFRYVTAYRHREFMGKKG